MNIIDKHHLLSNRMICRPLLSIPKGDLLSFCKTKKIHYFQDETNSDFSVSQRNYIRKEILAKLTHTDGKSTKFLHSMKNIYQQIEEVSHASA